MAIVTAEKIFVDVDDEINFVVEKILSSEKDRVILVVPQNALIISSQVSIKILAKQITAGKKLVVVVSEDDFGLKLAKQAGLVTANKVSNVMAETWEAAQIALTRSKAAATARKKELLTRRGLMEPETMETESESVTAPEVEIEESAEIEAVPADQGITESEPKAIDEDLVDELPESEIEQELEVEPTDESVEIEKEEDETAVAVEEQPIRGAIQRVRPQPKLVKVGNLEVFAAGDVSVAAAADEPDESEEDIANRFGNLFAARPKGGFTGRDLTRYAPKPEEPKGLARLFKRKPRRPLIDDLENGANTQRRKKIIIAIAVVGLLLLAGSVYAMTSQLNSVDITITLKTTEIPVSQTIVIDANRTEIDMTNLALPAIIVEQDDINGSDQATATGVGKGGTKASGSIEIWNFDTTQEYNLAAGTRIEHKATGRVYLTREAVTIPKGTKSGAGTITDPGGVDDSISIEAEQPGVEYNIEISGSSDIQEFKIANFGEDKLIGKGVDGSITGGTTENFTTPSQEDFDKLKEKIQTDLLRQGMIRLQASVPSGYRIIAGTEKFSAAEENGVVASPKVGEKTQNEFTISITGKINALAVRESDLEAAIAKLILANQDNPDGFEVSGLDNAVFEEVERTENTAKFLVTSAGNVRSRVDAEAIKQAIAGKSVEEARAYLQQQEDIQHFVVRFNLAFLPSGLQRVPSDLSRVSVRIN